MVDGFGEKHLIPHLSMSRRHNERHTRKKFAPLLAMLAPACRVAP